MADVQLCYHSQVIQSLKQTELPAQDLTEKQLEGEINLVTPSKMHWMEMCFLGSCSTATKTIFFLMSALYHHVTAPQVGMVLE